MVETMQRESRGPVLLEGHWGKRAKEVLVAQGRLCDFRVADIPEHELQEKARIARLSRWLNDPKFWGYVQDLKGGAEYRN